jgi:phosphatidylglycerol---prolipoprotein diacylglyceryl transferase
VPTAVIEFDFDPILRLGDDLAVRWQTVAVAAILFVGLLLLARLAARDGLRPDDLLFIVVAAVPGAVIGGRLGYVLIHADYYGANPIAIIDPSQGSLTLGLAVVGGTLTSGYIAHLLGADVGRWLHAAIVPLLFVLGVGKIAMVVGGSGQGAPADLPWAVAYLGPGPWGSLAPEIPSHPSQAYEGIAVLLVFFVMAVVLVVGGFRRRDGKAFAVGLLAWVVARGLVATTWRDDTVLGPLRAEHLVSTAIVLGCVFLALRPPRSPDERAAAALAERAALEWPEPASRPRF